MSPEARRAHLLLSQDATWQVRAPVRQRVRFEHHNLLHPAPLSPSGRGWDLIVCRNVFIYFNAHALTRALAHMTQALAPGGHIILGTSELQLGQAHQLQASPMGQGVVHHPSGMGRPPAAAPSLMTLSERSWHEVTLEHVESIRYPQDDLVRAALLWLAKLGTPKRW